MVQPKNFADSAVTCPPSRVNDVLALEISSPSTSAETVATTTVDTDTRFFVSSVKWCFGKRCLTSAPANAQAMIAAKTISPMSRYCSSWVPSADELVGMTGGAIAKGRRRIGIVEQFN